MKRKIILLLTAVLLYGMAIGVYALGTGDAAASCACCTDSCPMMKKDAAASAKSSCDCCDGDSCPMKGDHASMMKDMKNDPDHGAMMKKMADGDSCPMMKNISDADHAAMMKKMAVDGKSDGCSCCHRSKEKRSTASV